jgi:hypothetical protein
MRSIEQEFDPEIGRASMATMTFPAPGVSRPGSFSGLAVVPASPTRRRIRLTRRGRLVLLMVASALLLTAFSLGRVSTSAATDGARPSHVRHVVVQPGQSLWDIARQAAPGADPRQTVGRIVDLNGLTDATVRPGQALVLPS